MIPSASRSNIGKARSRDSYSSKVGGKTLHTKKTAAVFPEVDKILRRLNLPGSV
jgi:hypothetical protein